MIPIPRFKHPHYEPRGPATRPDNQGNWATARNPALGSPSHTCIERTSCRLASPSAGTRTVCRSPVPQLRGRKHCRGSSARSRRSLQTTKATPPRSWHTKRIGCGSNSDRRMMRSGRIELDSAVTAQRVRQHGVSSCRRRLDLGAGSRIATLDTSKTPEAARQPLP